MIDEEIDNTLSESGFAVQHYSTMLRDHFDVKVAKLRAEVHIKTIIL
jgi:hypothetical protein